MSTDSWRILRQKNNDNIISILEELTSEEQVLFNQVVSFEQDNRHLLSPSFKLELKKYVEQAIQPDSL